jgi:uncharacterized protein
MIATKNFALACKGTPSTAQMSGPKAQFAATGRIAPASRSLTRWTGALWLVLMLAFTGHGLAQVPQQKPAGYVNDFAGVISQPGKQRLEALCKELDDKARVQIAIVTVQSLQGRPIEDFSLDLATKWGVGHKDRPGDSQANGGILILLAIEERQNRIEVGYALESIITDGRAGATLRSMVPQLRAGDYTGALWLATASTAQAIAAGRGITLATVTSTSSSLETSEPQTDPFWSVYMLVLIFFLVYVLVADRRRRRSGRYPRTWGGPSGGWGGSGLGGGGGFGGFGGGSFGGGGASGRW